MNSSRLILVLVLLFFVAVAAAWFLHASRITALSVALQVQQRQIQALEEKLAAKSKTDLLDLQERCAKQAERQFLAQGFKMDGTSSYTNHYNAGLNQCFVLINSQSTTRKNMVVSNYLLDAYEGKSYGEGNFILSADQTNPLVTCEVTLPSGVSKKCASLDEFNSLIEIYMEEKSLPAKTAPGSKTN